MTEQDGAPIGFPFVLTPLTHSGGVFVLATDIAFDPLCVASKQAPKLRCVGWRSQQGAWLVTSRTHSSIRRRCKRECPDAELIIISEIDK
jgi:hypothetical protein